MTGFTMTVAGRTALVHPMFESTAHYFAAYLSDGRPELTVTVTADDLLFEQAELDREAVEEGFRFRKFTDPFLERAAIARAFAEDLFDCDTLMVHGSAVALDGVAYLFTAPSGTGKSTHTRLWREAFGQRTVMLNDDKPFLRLEANGVLACGSPWSGKHGMDTNLTLPLGGICLLERGAEDCICPLSAGEALPMLLKQAYCPLDPAKHLQFYQLVSRLTQQVPLWRLSCTKQLSAAYVAQKAMAGHLKEKIE